MIDQEEELYKQWAEEQLSLRDEELENDLFIDDLIFGVSMVRFSENGDATRIEPYSETYWDVMDKIHQEPYVFARDYSDEVAFKKL